MGENQITQYDILMKKLDSIIKENNLDPISIKSLLLSSVEFLDDEESNAQAIILTPSDLSNVKSIKLRNAKINLKFALNVIFSAKTIFSDNQMWMIFSILNVVNLLKDQSTITLGESEAIVLYVIYKLRRANEDKISRYIHDCDELRKDTINIEQSLDLLEKIGTIEMIGGEYTIKEIVIIRY